MTFLDAHILSILMLLPIVGAAMVVLARKDMVLARNLAAGIALAVCGLSWVPYVRGDASLSGMQFAEHTAWIPDLGISYSLGVDGISIPLLPLATFVVLLAVVVTCSRPPEREWAQHARLLAFMSASICALSATDLFLFYVAWALMSPAISFLIARTDEGRPAMRLAVGSAMSNLLMLASLISLASLYREQTGHVSFSLSDMRAMLDLPSGTQHGLFLGFAVSLAMGAFTAPFRAWFGGRGGPSPAADVLASGTVLCVGIYGLLRFAVPLFPDAATTLSPACVALTSIAVLCCGGISLLQTKPRRVFACSIAGHAALAMLGVASLTATGIRGAVVAVMCFALSSAGLYLCLGALGRRGSPMQGAGSRVFLRVPALMIALLFVLAYMDSALPGSGNFMGSLLVLLGAGEVSPWYAAIAALGAVLLAAGIIRACVLTVRCERERPSSARLPEIAALAPIVLVILILGIHSQPIVKMMRVSVDRLIDRVTYHDKPRPPVIALRDLSDAGLKGWVQMVSAGCIRVTAADPSPVPLAE